MGELNGTQHFVLGQMKKPEKRLVLWITNSGMVKYNGKRGFADKPFI